MNLEIPDIKLKGITKKFEKAGLLASLTDFYKLLAHIKVKSDRFAGKSGWVTVFKEQLELVSIHYLELLILMCTWGIIEIWHSDDSDYKIKVRIVESFRESSRKIKI